MNKKQLDGLIAASAYIKEQLNEARSAGRPRGKRYGKKLDYWKGLFDGLLYAECMLALAYYPEQKHNQIMINLMLKRK